MVHGFVNSSRKEKNTRTNRYLQSSLSWNFFQILLFKLFMLERKTAKKQQKGKQCVTEFLHTLVYASFASSILEMVKLESNGKTKKYPSNKSWTIHVPGMRQNI